MYRFIYFVVAIQLTSKLTQTGVAARGNKHMYMNSFCRAIVYKVMFSPTPTGIRTVKESSSAVHNHKYFHDKGMCGFLAGVLCFTLYLGVFSNGECHILKDWQNKVKSGKEERTIQGEQHVNKGCNISAGWNLTGRDLGCCGNYEGCCRMASRVCYLHDSICQCCRLGWIFCGPECKPETECLSTTEKWKTFSTNQSSSSTIISPSTNSSDMSSSMINETDTSNQENETSSITSSSSDIANTSKENKEPSLNSSSNTANKTDFNQMEPDLGNEPTNQRSENRRKMPAFFNNTNSEKERVTQTMGEMENEYEFPLLKTYPRHHDIIEGSGEDG